MYYSISEFLFHKIRNYKYSLYLNLILKEEHKLRMFEDTVLRSQEGENNRGLEKSA
jgi:hypothetical protein